MISTVGRILTCSVALASMASAQSFDYPDFTSVAGLVFNQDAGQASPALRVTPSAGNQVGSAYYQEPVRVETGFDTVIRFQMTQLSGGGADGMTFVIHNDPRGSAALGLSGGEMGYSGTGAPAGTAIANSLVFELDTYLSGTQGDLSANEVSVHTNGTGDNSNYESSALAHVSPTIGLSDGQVHILRVHYVPGTLEVYLDDLTTPLLSMVYDFGTGGNWVGGGAVGGLSLLSGGKAWIGFSAATGGAWENHDVLSWEWNSSGGPGTVYCSGDGTGSACPCGNFGASGEGCGNSMGPGGVLDSAGSASVALADLQLKGTQLVPFTPGLYFQGTDQLNGGQGVVFGDGLRCTGANARNIQVAFADAAGTSATTRNLITVGNVTAGSAFSYQLVYRDKWGPCNTRFNTTNALRVQFTP